VDPRRGRRLFLRVLDDQLFLLREWWPAEIRRPGFTAPLLVSLAAAGHAAGGGGGYDLEVVEWAASDPSSSRRKTAEALTRLGDSGSAVILLGGTYLAARFSGNRRLARTCSLSAEALINGAIYSTVLKKLTRRSRPVNGGTGEFFLRGTEDGQLTSSFPSGHATGAFAVASVFASRYRHRMWVPYVAYGTAGLIAWSRVELGRHFPSDVIAGALLGHSMGRMVARRDGEEGRPDRRGRLEPIIDPYRNGFGLAYRRSW
jgi:hypothetical protein